MRVGILGGGLSGIVLAYLLQKNRRITGIDILEKDEEVGGLCRTYNLNGICYDAGPHIIFSKNKEVLEMMVSLLGDNVSRLRRVNKVYYKGRLVKYPFENDLASLPEEDRTYCLNAFLNNPYAGYEPQDMLQFFLSNFGEGITNCYLRPYNEKIWKFDPAFIDTQMVGRIPRPPAGDIIKSAEGVPTEGYLHQLYFHYPKQGGIASLVRGFADRFEDKVNVVLSYAVKSIKKNGKRWSVKGPGGEEKEYDQIVSTIPLPALCKAMAEVTPEGIKEAVRDLRHNSIVICVLNLKRDNIGDTLAVYIPDKEIIFHRLSKMNFLMPSMDKGSTTLMAEITYRKGDTVDKMSDDGVLKQVLDDLEKAGFIDAKSDLNFSEVRRFEYAYVIYDLNHRRNMKVIKDFYETKMQLVLCGRFGEFEYLNMDTVIEHSMEKAEHINRVLEGA